MLLILVTCLKATIMSCSECFDSWQAHALLKQKDNHNIKAIDDVPSSTTVPENGLNLQTLELAEHGMTFSTGRK